MWGNITKGLAFVLVIWGALAGLLASFYSSGVTALGHVPLLPTRTVAEAAGLLSQFHMLAADAVGAPAASFRSTTLAGFAVLSGLLLWQCLRLWLLLRLRLMGRDRSPRRPRQRLLFGSLGNGILAMLLISGLVVFTGPVFEARAKRSVPDAPNLKSQETVQLLRNEQVHHNDKELRNGKVGAAPTDAAITDNAQSFEKRLREADPGRGARKIVLCQSCHSLHKGGPPLAGANLWGVVGRDIASVEGVYYSQALESLDGVWTPAVLEAFLKSPTQYAPGTVMMVGVRNDRDRADIIAFLIGNAD